MKQSQLLPILLLTLLTTIAITTTTASASTIIEAYTYIDQQLAPDGTILEVYNINTNELLTSVTLGSPYEGFSRFTIACNQDITFDLKDRAVELYAVSGQSGYIYSVPCEADSIVLMFRTITVPEPQPPQDILTAIQNWFDDLLAWIISIFSW